jgi:hypothetical protein
MGSFFRAILAFLFFLFISIKGIFILVGTLLAFAIILGFPIMWLWNWLTPDLFGFPEINFWQALGLYLLFGALFKASSSSDSSLSKKKATKTTSSKYDYRNRDI